MFTIFAIIGLCVFLLWAWRLLFTAFCFVLCVALALLGVACVVGVLCFVYCLLCGGVS